MSCQSSTCCSREGHDACVWCLLTPDPALWRRNPDALHLVYEQKKTHTVQKNNLQKHVWRFRQRGLWFAIFCPALFIWTRIYRWRTERDDVLCQNYGGRESSMHCYFIKHVQTEKAPANQETSHQLTAGGAKGSPTPFFYFFLSALQACISFNKNLLNEVVFCFSCAQKVFL